MKGKPLLAAAVIVLLAIGANADIAPTKLRDVIQDSQKSIAKKLALHVTNAAEIAQQMVNAYDAQHPTDVWLEVLSVKQLQKLVKERTNDLAPRFLLLGRELADDQDCGNWFLTLKEAYGLCTNEVQRVTSLALGTMGVAGLMEKPFGKEMLVDLSQWLEKLSSQHPSLAVKDKIQCLRLFVALGTEAYAEVSLYARGTAFRTLVPLWLMSKGKWELALHEVRELKKFFDLLDDEKDTLEVFESVLKGITEKKPAK